MELATSLLRRKPSTVAMPSSFSYRTGCNDHGIHHSISREPSPALGASSTTTLFMKQLPCSGAPNFVPPRRAESLVASASTRAVSELMK